MMKYLENTKSRKYPKPKKLNVTRCSLTLHPYIKLFGFFYIEEKLKRLCVDNILDIRYSSYFTNMSLYSKLFIIKVLYCCDLGILLY